MKNEKKISIKRRENEKKNEEKLSRKQMSNARNKKIESILQI